MNESQTESRPSDTERRAAQSSSKSCRVWRQKAFSLGLSALVILPLATELACRIQRKSRDRVARQYLKAHPTLYDQTRYAMEAAADSLWLEKFWSYRPGAKLTADVGGLQYVVSINRLGYRDREFTVEKPPGVIRIACVGGSTTVQGVRNDETYPAILQKLLRARFAERVEVINLGISGYNSYHWVQTKQLSELLRLKPDVVVQYDGINDICHVHIPEYERLHPVKAWLRKSLLLNRCLPIKPAEMGAIYAGSALNLQVLHEALRTNGMIHVVGTFARPDATRATPQQRVYFDFNAAQWGDWDHSTLRYYGEYAPLLDYFNAVVLAQGAQREGWRLSPVHQRISAPTKFVDICHMTPEGVADLAKAFEPEVAEAVESALRTRGNGL